MASSGASPWGFPLKGPYGPMALEVGLAQRLPIAQKVPMALKALMALKAPRAFNASFGAQSKGYCWSPGPSSCLLVFHFVLLSH